MADLLLIPSRVGGFGGQGVVGRGVEGDGPIDDAATGRGQSRGVAVDNDGGDVAIVGGDAGDDELEAVAAGGADHRRRREVVDRVEELGEGNAAHFGGADVLTGEALNRGEIGAAHRL